MVAMACQAEMGREDHLAPQVLDLLDRLAPLDLLEPDCLGKCTGLVQ